MFQSVEIIESVTVDTSREDTIMLRFDISFYDMPCKDVSVDLVDQNGMQQDLQPSRIEKIKLEKTVKIDKISAPLCTKCYDNVNEDIIECCSCDDINRYFLERPWIIYSVEDSVQCKEERTRISLEGCRVKGEMTALKISGNFHVAPGTVVTGKGGSHTHTMNPFTLLADLEKTRLSHTVHLLSFGYPYPGQSDTLNEMTFLTKDVVRHVYYLRLVPTVYIDGTEVVRTHQYSVTNHTEVIDLKNTLSWQLPGIFWKYDFSPMLVKLERREKYFSHFLTRLCAIVGGTWVVLGLLYTVTQQALDKLSKKKN